MRFFADASVAAPDDLVGLINGASSGTYQYVIGPITSADAGTTWTVGGSAVISPSVAAWKTIYVKDPSLVWDGSQYVCFYTGWNGTNFQIGRATAATVGGTWTDYGSNPIIVLEAGTAPDNSSMFPVVLYDITQTPAWKMWYTGLKSGGIYTTCFADSSDGLAWTKRGRVMELGTAGAFDDTGAHLGAALRVGTTWYVYYAGWQSDTFRHSGYATCTDPADSTTYTRHGQLSGFGTPFSLGGYGFRSNMIRSIIPYGARYLVTGSAWNAPALPQEGAWSVVADDPVTIPVPTGLLIPLGSGWYANSAENPSVFAP